MDYRIFTLYVTLLFFPFICQGSSPDSQANPSMVLRGLKSYPKVKNGLKVITRKTKRVLEDTTGLPGEYFFHLGSLAVQLSQQKISTDLFNLQTKIDEWTVRPILIYKFDNAADGVATGTIEFNYSF
jgi:hypothetical protein